MVRRGKQSVIVRVKSLGETSGVEMSFKGWFDDENSFLAKL